jgi:hypothetical protein
MKVSLQYSPPGGFLGALFAKLFGEEPSQQVEEDLHCLKESMETGEIRAAREHTIDRRHWRAPVTKRPEVAKAGFATRSAKRRRSLSPPVIHPRGSWWGQRTREGWK